MEIKYFTLKYQPVRHELSTKVVAQLELQDGRRYQKELNISPNDFISRWEYIIDVCKRDIDCLIETNFEPERIRI